MTVGIYSFAYIVIIFILVQRPNFPLGSYPLTHPQVILCSGCQEWNLVLVWLIKIGRLPWTEGTVREFGINMYILLYLRWITNKNLLYSTGNSAQCYVAAWMGSLREMDTCICMAESLCCPPETITALLTGYTPI